MKKIFLLMLVAVLGLTATSCSKSDDTPLVNEHAIKGSWRQVSYTLLDKDLKRTSDVILAVNNFNWQATEMIFKDYDGRQIRYEKDNRGGNQTLTWNYEYKVKDNQLVLIDKKNGLDDLEIYSIDEITKNNMYIRYHLTRREVEANKLPKNTTYILYFYTKL